MVRVGRCSEGLFLGTADSSAHWADRVSVPGSKLEQLLQGWRKFSLVVTQATSGHGNWVVITGPAGFQCGSSSVVVTFIGSVSPWAAAVSLKFETTDDQEDPNEPQNSNRLCCAQQAAKLPAGLIWQIGFSWYSFQNYLLQICDKFPSYQIILNKLGSQGVELVFGLGTWSRQVHCVRVCGRLFPTKDIRNSGQK